MKDYIATVVVSKTYKLLPVRASNPVEASQKAAKTSVLVIETEGGAAQEEVSVISVEERTCKPQR